MQTNLSIQNDMIDKEGKIYCLSCELNTNHKITHALLKTDTEVLSEDLVNQDFTYYITAYCTICNSVSFIEKNYTSFILDEDGYPIVSYIFYPPRVIFTKNNLIIDTIYLPIKIRRLYNETLHLFTHEKDKSIIISNHLRTMIDLIYNDKFSKNNREIKKKTHDKINELRTLNIFSRDEIELLESVTKKGGHSTHRGYEFYIKDLAQEFIDLIIILKKLYINIPNKKWYLEVSDDIESQKDIL